MQNYLASVSCSLLFSLYLSQNHQVDEVYQTYRCLETM